MTGMSGASASGMTNKPYFVDSSSHRDDIYELQKKLNKNGKQSVAANVHQQAQAHVKEQMNQLQDVDGVDKWDTDYALAQDGDSVLSGGIAVLYTFMNLLSELANGKYMQMQEKAKMSRDAQNMANEVNEKIADVSKQGDKGKAQLPDDVVRYMRHNQILVDGKTIDEYLGKQDPQLKCPVTIDSNSVKYSSDYKGSKGNIKVFISPDGKTLTTSGINPWPRIPKQYYSIKGNQITLTNVPVEYNNAAVRGYISLKGTISPDPAEPPIPAVKLDKGQLEAIKDALENVSNRASDFVSQSQLQLQKIMQTYNVTVSLINSMQTMLQEMNKSIAQNIR